MNKLPCDFNWSDPIASIQSIKNLESANKCSHVAVFDTVANDEFEAFLLTSPSCMHENGNWNSDCGRIGPKVCQLFAVPKIQTGRRYPDPIVISCLVESHETDVLTFAADTIPNVVLNPFSVKGGLGRHSIAEKSVAYEISPLGAFRFASGSYQANINRSGESEKSLTGPFLIAVPESQGETKNDGLGELPTEFSSLNKTDLQKWTQVLVHSIRKKGIALPFDMRNFIKRQTRGMALEAELLRHFFITNGKFLNELMSLRTTNQSPSKEQIERQKELFGRNSLMKLFGSGSGTITYSQVYKFATDNLLPKNEKVSRGNKVGFEIAEEQKSLQQCRDLEEQRKEFRGELAQHKNALSEEDYFALESMIDNEAFEIPLIKQKLGDMLNPE